MDVKDIGFPIIRANLSLAKFTDWCKSHNWTGDYEKAYNNLREKAGKPIEVIKPKKNKE